MSSGSATGKNSLINLCFQNILTRLIKFYRRCSGKIVDLSFTADPDLIENMILGLATVKLVQNVVATLDVLFNPNPDKLIYTHINGAGRFTPRWDRPTFFIQ